MAMTKKERAEFDAAILRAETLAALRWTGPVCKDVEPPNGGCYADGWDFSSYTAEVWQAWSSSVVHGRGPAPKTGRHSSASQNGVHLFSTKERALAALRHAIEQEAAAKLLKIDKQIAAATSPNEGGNAE
jgi:hypothetical protein